MRTYPLKSSPLYLTLFAALSANAVTFTYTGVDGSNDWSTGTDWDATPASDSTTIIEFTGVLGDGAAITSNNDVADPFTLNRMNLLNVGPDEGVRPTVTLNGGDLSFVADGSTNPQLQVFPSGTLDPYYTINNNISSADPLTLFVNSTVLTLNGQISGAGSISYTGSTGSQYTSRVILNNTSNDWSGGLSMGAGGTVGYSRTLQLGASEVIPDGAGKGDVTMTSNGEGDAATIFRLNGFNETINGAQATYGENMRNKDYKRVFENGGDANSTLTVGANDATASFLGILRDGGGAGNFSLVKIGSGTQTLAGRSYHTGTTTVNGGALVVDFTQLGTSQTADPSNYFSANSNLVLNGDATFGIVGRTNGAAYFQAGAGTQQYSNYITLADTTGLVVGQAVEIDNGTTVIKRFITGIVGNRIYTDERTGGGPRDVTIFATTATTTQNVAGLTLGAGVGENATIDFGTSDNVTLIFNASPVQLNDGSTITFSNWSGNAGVGGGSDQLLFAGTTTDFSSVFDQSEVIFDGYGTGYALIDLGGGFYEVAAAAVPEPSTYALFVGCGVLLWAMRRRQA